MNRNGALLGCLLNVKSRNLLKTSMLMRGYVFLSLLTLGAISCGTDERESVRDTVLEFYQVYGERKDAARFLAFYAEEAVLEDIVNGDSIVGRRALATFFDWSNPEFKSLSNRAVVVDEVIVEGSKAVVKGHFTRFQWGGTAFEAMHFTTWLTFNKQGMIIRQVDWINYPSTLVDYSARKNSNAWIK
jgi:hypothetical protein